MKKIALCMIVKDEAKIIRRCLESARPLIDAAMIVDTGSCDETIAVLRQAFLDLGVAGRVIEEPWRDFAYNRSHALACLREDAAIDYALMIDADDSIVLANSFDPEAFRSGLEADLVNVWTRLGGYAYTRPQLISNRKPFFFRGVLHEFLECPTPFLQTTTTAFHSQSLQDSARNERGDKFERDVQTLSDALEGETDPFLRARYTFYLAQSWRDARRPKEALEAYVRRSQMGFWEEEVYISLCHAGQLTEALERPDAEAIDFYLRAFDLCPARAEALHAAARLCRLRSRFQTGYLIAGHGVELARPSDGLFLADWIYRYGMKDEFAILAYWTGRYAECLQTCSELLALPDLPASDRTRIRDNANFARSALGLTPA